jgi:NodT family efflux transporter outer membrane factor (OMF) lipoprotein
MSEPVHHPSAPSDCARRARLLGLHAIWAILLLCGCTPWREYVDNGFKVGPNYSPPPAPIETDWIDAADERVRSETDDLSDWWKVFNDPVLDNLICTAYRQNLTLREAGFRVLAARAQLGIAIGNFFPQQQYMAGDYTRNALSAQTANNLFQFGLPNVTRYFDQWDYNFGLSWELDFWGRFRRAIEANSANLDASVANYDDVLVTLLGDVASNYVQLRALEQQIAYTKENVELQRETLTIVEARYNAQTIDALDLHQARSNVAQTEAQIEELEINKRLVENLLCVLMGMPPHELKATIGPGSIPTASTEIAAGIPADLLRRRPDIRRAERLAAAQSAQVGVAVSEFYPHVAITGTIGYSAEDASQLFQPASVTGSVGPGFQWNLLNYGRILNNVRLQDATLARLITDYQNTVLNASREVEDGLVRFLRAQARVEFQTTSVDEAEQAVKLVLVQYKAGTIDFTRVTQLELNLVQQKDVLAQAKAEVGQGLVQVYKALGGGWEIKCTGCEISEPANADELGMPIEELPTPALQEAAANADMPIEPASFTPQRGASLSTHIGALLRHRPLHEEHQHNQRERQHRGNPEDVEVGQ